MYWHLRDSVDDPRRISMDVLRKENAGILKDKVEIASAMRMWSQAMGRYYFSPNEKSLMFFLSSAMVKFISGGNRSGKTGTCALDVVMQCEGWHPMQRENLEKLIKEGRDSYEYYSGYEKKWNKIDTSWLREYCKWVLDNKAYIASAPVNARCITVDFPNGVEKFCGPEVIRWASKGELKEVQYENEKRRRIIWKNESTLEFMTTDQELDAHGGTARHTIWFDEEPPSTYWMENMMRIVSTRGRMLLGMTAVNGITWPKHEIWDKWEEIVVGNNITA